MQHEDVSKTQSISTFRAARHLKLGERVSNWHAPLKRVGRIDAAVEEAHRAKTLLSELKAELEAGRAQSVLDGLAALQSTARPAVSKVKSNELTQREIEILRLVAEGLNNQTIAERLFVSDHTVHRHLANILNKLGVATRAAAVAQAARRGLLR
jgi:DNA-binding NarL/FixJ family response regulator